MQSKRLSGTGAALWLVATLLAQTPPTAPASPASPAGPAFEVASIKTAPPLDPAKIMAGTLHLGMSIDAARVDIGNASLADLIRIAYRVKPYQITGPAWMSSQRFDVLAKMPEGGTKEQVPDMLQALLAERFKLTAHRDSKEHSVYALVVGKNGSKLKEAALDAAAPPPPPADATPPSRPGLVIGSGDDQVRIKPNTDGKGATVAGGPFGQMKITMGDAGMMHLEFARLSMQGLADMLSRYTDRPVVNLTELKGTYLVGLDLSLEEMRAVAMATAAQAGIPIPPMAGRGGGDGGMKSPADSASTPSGGSMFAAIQNLGLKLEPRKAPLETVVVDHLEKTPTEN